MSSKAKIESAAHESVQRSGLKSLSFRTLGAQVGVKSSSVHYHFPEKADLCRALISNYQISLQAYLADLSQSDNSLHNKMMQLVDLFVTECEKGNFCLGGALASEADALSDENRKLVNEFFDTFREWITNEFDSHRDQLTTDLPSNTLAGVLLTGLEGAMLLDRCAQNCNYINAQKTLISSWWVTTH